MTCILLGWHWLPYVYVYVLCTYTPKPNHPHTRTRAYTHTGKCTGKTHRPRPRPDPDPEPEPEPEPDPDPDTNTCLLFQALIEAERKHKLYSDSPPPQQRAAVSENTEPLANRVWSLGFRLSKAHSSRFCSPQYLYIHTSSCSSKLQKVLRLCCSWCVSCSPLAYLSLPPPLSLSLSLSLRLSRNVELLYLMCLA
jgi:hypothetical protein